MEVAQHQDVMDVQLREQMEIEMRRLGFPVVQLGRGGAVERSVLASAPPAVLGSGCAGW